jgi:hypothetical protein
MQLQTHLFHPLRDPGQHLAGLDLAVAVHEVVGVALEHHRRVGSGQPRVECVVHEQVRQHRRHDSSNAMGNFCFEVSLSYRRLERLPRVTGGL